METLGWSQEDKSVIDLWDRECVKIDGHYQLPIPWKNRDSPLPNNFQVAKSRLDSLCKKLKRDNLTERYDQEITKLLANGYAEKVPDNEISNAQRVWYLPHHSVITEKKPDKLRVVYDCACTFHGESLNDRCLQGPDLVNKLVHVLLRFRLHKYAIQADIEAMYNQIRIPPNDRDALRFLWYCENELTHFRMTSHLFGGIWCSSSSTYALRRTIQDSDNVHPLVKDTVENSFYVDDCLKSVPQREQAEVIIKNTPEVLKEGGFNLLKFIVTDKDLLSGIPADHRAKEVRDLGPEMSGKVLGVKWDISRDLFLFDVNNEVNYTVTRRKMLSITASIYDPLGFVGPIVLAGKLLFQEATRLKLTWDEVVPPALETKWRQWLASLGELTQFEIPRCMKPTEFDDATFELHHFADASQQAYGACTYVRCVNRYGAVHTQLVMSKNKVTPLKSCTIPRLELQAATLAVKIDSVLRNELHTKIDQSYFWTDSEVVLKYIKNQNKRFHVYVSNRVSRIRESSSPDQWRYVNTAENPADMLTRCTTASKLGTKWTEGPAWMRHYKSTWPTADLNLELCNDDPEIKCCANDVIVTVSHVRSQHDPVDKLIRHYSSWYKMKRALAWLRRLLNVLKHKCPNQDRLSVKEIRQAEQILIRHCQLQEYPGEVAKLACGKSVSSSSSLISLSPYLDDHGIMRVGGRLSQLNDGRLHPIIIPHNHAIAKAVILEIHNASHVGVEWTTGLLRRRYWVIRARSAVKRVAKACVVCRKLYAQTCSQKMADLPIERLSPNEPPFTFVGIDAFGPYLVKRGRSEIKRYGCIMSCMVTRAVHLEKLDCLETNSFINAFRRFVARRGVPKKVFSDNGTNFVGGEKEMRLSMQDISPDKVQEYAVRNNIDWHFNPLTAAHMGGVWERMVGAVKKVFKAILSNVQLTDEILETLFVEVESILNGRPLTKLSDDPSDATPLTPNHLLLLREGPSLPPGEFSKHDEFRRRWRHVQHLANVFWKRWVRLYLPILQRRDKWHTVQPNLGFGDLVLIADENTPRNLWPLGLVDSVYHGRDGLVRTVKVRTRSTLLVRPITKLVMLEAYE